MNYAQIKNGIIQNIIVLNETVDENGTDLIALFGQGWDAFVRVDNLDPQPHIGWNYDGTNFTPGGSPSDPTLPNDLSGTLAIGVAFNGIAQQGRYLEFTPGISSDQSPYLVMGTFSLLGISFNSIGTNTVGVALYRNGAQLTTLSLSGETSIIQDAITGISFQRGDGISVQVISGSVNKPVVTLYLG